MADPILTIDLASTVPVYRQIVDALRALLVAGSLPPGHLLPTVRHLAAQLGVHHNTVAQAYRCLAEEGWLDLRRRRGAQVLKRTHPPPGPAAGALAEDRFARRLRELAASARAEGLAAPAVARILERLRLEMDQLP